MSFWNTFEPQSATGGSAYAGANGATGGTPEFDQAPSYTPAWQNGFTEVEEMTAPEPVEAPVVADTPPAYEEPAPLAAAPEAAPEPEPLPYHEPVPGTDRSKAHIHAGPGISMKAEVTGCDSFELHGEFQGHIAARHLLVSPTGVFKGTGSVQVAEIQGRVEGALTAHEVLIVRASGHAGGTIRYGEIEVERGGKLEGDVKVIVVKPAVVEPVAAAEPVVADMVEPAAAAPAPEVAAAAEEISVPVATDVFAGLEMATVAPKVAETPVVEPPAAAAAPESPPLVTPDPWTIPEARPGFFSRLRAVAGR